MKSLFAILATVFALSAFAADAPKADAKPVEVTATKPAKSEVKPVKSEPAKKEAKAEVKAPQAK